MFIFFTWILLSFVGGYIGSDRKIGFFGAFALCLFLSPLIGIIIAALSKYEYEEEYENTVLETQVKQQATLEKIVEQAAQKSTVSVSDELIKLKSLMDQGVLSEQEFEVQKQRILK
jgi:hypothetical protein